MSGVELSTGGGLREAILEAVGDMEDQYAASDYSEHVPLGAVTATLRAILAAHEAPSEPEGETVPEYPASHGFTPSTGPFSTGEGCRVMLARYPCPHSREEHDPALPPVDVDVFGYRRDRFDQEATNDA